ncbi:hypothetical protein DPMN_001373 [Dreissena polymorpha]|uniref:Uncharacterized protein n=1 Tax=Dreissena polymorpha TaxID=45954 RepID=A0A9D4RQB0_DREPO|nr:hypothetical protein DPMN_001373 [Dreissena polymorpha]
MSVRGELQHPFQLIKHRSNVCEKIITSQHLESECESVDGMAINFQLEACQDTSLTTQKVKHLICTDT